MSEDCVGGYVGGYKSVGGFPAMPLTVIDVKRLPIKENRYKKSVG